MPSIKPRQIWTLLKETVLEWIDDNPFRLSAALSYYTVFSLAPLLIIVLFIVGLFWGEQSGSAQAQLLAQVEQLTGPEGADMIGTMLENADRPGSGGVLATILGFGALLFGATAVFAQLQESLNTIWEVKPREAGLKGLLLARALSFGMILGIGFLLLVSLIISALLAAVDAYARGLAPALHVVMNIVNLVVTLGVVTLLFAMIYRYLPDVELAWRDVLVGAGITALLFTLGKTGIGLYLGNSSVASTYGAAGSLAVLLLWVYYSAMIVFFGAEFTQVYVRHYGKRPLPSAHAVRDEGQAEGKPGVPVPEASLPPAVGHAPSPSRLKQAGLILLGVAVGRFLGRRGA